MDSKRTSREAVDIVVRSIDNWLDAGLCSTCAIRATSAQFMIPYEKTKDVYVERKAESLDDPRD